ncbi:MAG TPA: hypothetical protein VH088_02390 [Terriglobales bacterium]|jgi:hypothetical protein|nr:hypothetical protein [Terriglobales bacterium]
MVAILIRMLEGIFALGLLGSSVVLLLTLIEDAKMLFEKDKKLDNVLSEPASTPTPSVMQVAATR